MLKSSDEKKQTLLEMARNGGNKPNAKSKDIKEKKLGSALVNYTNKSTKVYDQTFTFRMKILRPDWFSNKTNEKKKKLLEMAKNGISKPREKSKNAEERKLGYALWIYNCESHCSYDEEFCNKIKTLRPDWFLK